MSIEIKLHKNDLPDDLNLGNVIAVDGEFMGLNVRRDPLCLIQISSFSLFLFLWPASLAILILNRSAALM